MAKRYRPVERDQLFLLPPDMRSWLAADHPVWLVISAVEEHLDTSALHARRRTGGAGAAGYDPDMLVTVLIWAYAHQVTSSRRIEALCGTDVAFRVICGGGAPDHVTIARFRSDFPEVIEDLFAQVLILCARLGMGQLGVVALDGMKIAASASKSANRTEETLRKMAAETVARHGEADAAEDDLLGPGRRGDEVPPEAADPRTRSQKIGAALRAARIGAAPGGLQAEREAAEQEQDARAGNYLERQAAGRSGRPPRGAEVAAARARLARETAAQQARCDDWQQRDARARQAGHKGPAGSRPVPPGRHGSPPPPRRWPPPRPRTPSGRPPGTPGPPPSATSPTRTPG